MIRSALAILFVGSLTAGSPSRPTVRDARSTAAAPTVVLLVRHAEKAAEPANDPPLTEQGERRAQALAAVARDAGVRAIVTTQFARTKLTAAPLAKASGIDPVVVAAVGPADAHARAVAEAVRSRFAGQTVLVVGHSNTIPAIVGALGVPRPADLCDSQYDQLFVVILGDDGSAKLIRSRFGAPSEDGPGCRQM